MNEVLSCVWEKGLQQILDLVIEQLLEKIIGQALKRMLNEVLKKDLVHVTKEVQSFERGVDTALGYCVGTGIVRNKKKINNEREKEEYKDKVERIEDKGSICNLSSHFHF